MDGRLYALLVVAAAVGCSAPPGQGATSSAGTTGSSTGAGTSSSGGSTTGDAGVCPQCHPGTPCPLPDGETGVWCNAFTVFPTCVDVTRDPLNCGDCGNACLKGQVCVAGPLGYSVCSYSSCAQAAPGGDYGSANCVLADGGQGGCCEGACQDPSFFIGSATNCGVCGLACAAGTACAQGICSTSCTGPTTCPAGYDCTSNGDCLASCDSSNDNTYCELDGGAGVCCQGTCRDLTHDPTSCGACGAVCPSGTVCAHSSCLPAATCSVQTELLPCDLGGGREGACCAGTCVDTTSDPANCGTCGTACPAGMVCRPSDVGAAVLSYATYAAACVLADGGSLQSCPVGQCPSGDFCGYATFPGPFCAPATCTGLPLGSSCLVGPNTLSLCCTDGCADLTQDPNNCGVCGNICQSGLCFGGGCLPPSGAGQAQSCSTFGSLCDFDGGSGLCCGQGGAGSYDWVCADVASDPSNCGHCYQACRSGETCQKGVCSGVPSGCRNRQSDFCALDAGATFVCCSETGCTDLAIDPNNCGACGNQCTGGHPCVGGGCT